MGRQAKLKKIKRNLNKSTPVTEEKASNADDFVVELRKEGYSLKQTSRCPDVPEDRINPQI